MKSFFKQYSEETVKEFQNALKKLSKAIAVEGKQPVGEGEFEVIATTEGLDRDGEVIKVDGWDFTNFMKNPVMLFGHDYWSMPIGAAKEVSIEEGRVVVRGVFAATERGQEVRKLYEDGILRTVSVGFIPKERNGNIITKAELLEVSFVPVPSNPEALSLAKMNSILMVLKTATEATITKMDESAEWQAEAAHERVKEWATIDGVLDAEKYKQAFAFTRESEKRGLEGFFLYKDVVNGLLLTNFKGVCEAMRALLSEAIKDFALSDEEKKTAHETFCKQYEEFGKTPPELKSYTHYELDQIFGENGGEAKQVSELDELKQDVKAIKRMLLGEDVKQEEKVVSKDGLALLKLTIANLQKVCELVKVDETGSKEIVDGAIQDLRQIDKIVGAALSELKLHKAT